MMEIIVAPMEAGHWPEVAAIYRDGIATGHATFELEVPSFEHWDRSHLPVARLIARQAKVIAGWAALSPVSQRRVYAGVAEVSVYVSSACRGAGVGRKLLDAL